MTRFNSRTKCKGRIFVENNKKSKNQILSSSIPSFPRLNYTKKKHYSKTRGCGGDFRVATEKVNKKFDFQIKKGSTNKSEIIFFESFVMF